MQHELGKHGNSLSKLYLLVFLYPFYMNEDQYKTWKHTDLTIDAINGMGGMFSLDNGTGRRFLTKSEVCIVEDDKN